MPKEIRQCGKSTGQLAWYQIGDMEFYQDTCVLGQSTKIVPYLHGMSFGDLNSKAVLEGLGERIGEVLEIVLVPKAMTQEEHVRELMTPGKVERAEVFLRHLNHYDLMVMVEDFFGCNLDTSLMTLIQRGVQGLLNPRPAPTTPDGSAPSSPEATPPIEAPSLG